MAKKLLNIRFKLTQQEIRKIFNWRKLALASIGALLVHFLILSVISFPWEGWNVVIATVGGIIFAEYLD